MGSVLKRRLIAAPIVLAVIILIGFAITNVLPGNPAQLRAGQYASEEVIDRIEASMGLDKPWYEQFGVYVGNLAQGDLGENSLTGVPVSEDLGARFPATLELSIAGFVLGLAFGLPLGILSALRRNSLWDHVGRLVAVLGVSLPVFWVGLILIYVFYATLDIAPPPTGRLDLQVPPPTDITGLYTVDALLTGNLEAFWAATKSLVLPAITLALIVAAPIARISRAAVLDVMGQEYVSMAITSGLPRRVVITRYVLRNAMLSVLTMMGILLGYLIGGNILVEIVFAWEGVGRYAYEAVNNNDYAPLQAFVLLTAIAILIINLVLDLLYAWLDPRVRYGTAAE